MFKNLPEGEVTGKWIPKHEEEDFPVKILDHMDWLRGSGFKNVDVVWKFYGFAVFGGKK